MAENMLMSAETLMAARDPGHPQHSSAIGKVLASVLLGATDALRAATDQPHTGVYLHEFVTGFIQIWFTQKPPG
jgi:hypothetical protein